MSDANKEPAVRTHFLRCSLTALDSLEPAPALPGSLLADIERVRSAPPLSWQPVELLLALAEQAYTQLGEAGARALIHRSMDNAMGAGLWHRLVKAALRSFAITPVGMARWVPHLYSRVFRGTGVMEVERASEREATIEFPRSARRVLRLAPLRGRTGARAGVLLRAQRAQRPGGAACLRARDRSHALPASR